MSAYGGYRDEQEACGYLDDMLFTLEEPHFDHWMPNLAELEPVQLLDELPDVVYEYHERLTSTLGREVRTLLEHELLETSQPCADDNLQGQRSITISEIPEQQSSVYASSSVSSEPSILSLPNQSGNSKAGVKVEPGSESALKEKRKYNKYCTVPGCQKQTKKSAIGHAFCIGHGGGFNCIEPNCRKAALQSSTKCIKHGGGNQCVARNCTTTARPSSNFCGSHRMLFVNFECLMNPNECKTTTIRAYANMAQYGRNTSRRMRTLAKAIERRFSKLSRAKRKAKLQRFAQFESIRNNVSLQ